jgi:hypothetical protein
MNRIQIALLSSCFVATLFCASAGAAERDIYKDGSNYILSLHRGWIPSSEGFNRWIGNVLDTDAKYIHDLLAHYILLETQLFLHQFLGYRLSLQSQHMMSKVFFCQRVVYLSANVFYYLGNALNAGRIGRGAFVLSNFATYHYYANWRLELGR